MHLLAFAESIQLFPDGTIFIHIALILFMIWILNRTFFKPINRVISERAKFRGGHNPEADELLASVSEKEQKYETGVRDARSEGYSLIEKERNEAVRARQEKLAIARSEAHASLESGTHELDQQTSAARSAIESEADHLAEKISANILKA